MPASILASIISFIITGIYTWAVSSMQLPSLIKTSLFISILANSVYFFYFEAVTEVDKDLQTKLKSISRFEWYLRMSNQTLLFSLWFLFDLNLIAFCSGLIVLYFLFIIWDNYTKSCFENRFLFYMDVFGLVFSIIFVAFILVNSNVFSFLLEDTTDSKEPVTIILSNDFSFVWGVVAFIYLVIPSLAISINESDLLFKFGKTSKSSTKLFNKKAWSREGLT